MSTRTNIVLDDQLVAQAMQRAGVTTKKAAVEAALRWYTRKPDYAAVLALAGSGALADGYDPSANHRIDPAKPEVRVRPPRGKPDAAARRKRTSAQAA